MSSTKKEIIEILERQLERDLEEDRKYRDEWGDDYYKPLKQYGTDLSMYDMIQRNINRTKVLLNELKGLGVSQGRKEGINKAREARTAKTKEKVQNAINLLRIEGKEITAYQVAKVADISFNTAKKYLESINQKAPAV